MRRKTLTQITEERPFPDYAAWWVMGDEFIRFMSQAITAEWEKLASPAESLDQVKTFVSEYIQTVYNREADISLVDRFFHQDFSRAVNSGEFDALSYAFYRSAFELLADNEGGEAPSSAKERRLFANRVGREFFTALHNHLRLNLPSGIESEIQFALLQENISRIGDFLVAQGYLRDLFAFSFDVDVTHAGKRIRQDAGDFLHNLHNEGTGYAIYKMGYPAILPSAVYLYHTHGEAQHHSSRTIEDLFDQISCKASETDDFDPTGFPSDAVVELWEIRST